MARRAVTRRRGTPAPPQVTRWKVAFDQVTAEIDPVRAFGYCCTGYTGDGGDLRTSQLIRTRSAALAAGVVRFGCKWSAELGRPVAGAVGGLGVADDWVVAIKDTLAPGGILIGIMEGDVRVQQTSYPEMGITPQDAAAIVHYYNDGDGGHGGPIKYWVIGNEPDLNSQKYDYRGRQVRDGRIYADLWCEIYAAMMAADSSLIIGGPTASQFSGHAKLPISGASSPGGVSQFWNDFLGTSRAGVGRPADLIGLLDYHTYGTGNYNEDTTAVLNRVLLPATTLPSLRQLVDAYASGPRAAGVPVVLSEYNFTYRVDDGRPDLVDDTGAPADGRPISAAATVYVAATILNVLRGNGWALQFGDLVGPLGLYIRNDGADTIHVTGGLHRYPHGRRFGDRYPAYFGVGMWTGMGLMPRWGRQLVHSTLVGGQATGMQVLACNSQRSLMLINRDETATRNLRIAVSGVDSGTTIQVWATNPLAPWDAPTRQPDLAVCDGAITGVLVGPMTVVRMVFV